MEDEENKQEYEGNAQNGEEDIETAEAVSANEMTGLISSRPADESEEAAYDELLHYKAGKTTNKREKERDAMSMTINIYYTGRNGAARKFAAEMEESGLAKEVRAEEGNEKYEYFFPMNDPETVLLIDRWKDQAALDAHHSSAMMPKIAALREKYKLKMRVEKFLPKEDK